MLKASRSAAVVQRLHGFSAITILFIGFSAACTWTILGSLISLSGVGLEAFLREWILLQGFPLLALGVTLSLISRSPRLENLANELGCRTASFQVGTRVRRTMKALVTLLGAASLISMGFPASNLLLLFMWITCFLICLMASSITIHCIEVLRFSSFLNSCGASLQPYSPADTPVIRKLAEYIALFGMVVSIGYCFAFIGTASGNWTSSSGWVRAVKYFWPSFYVPLCLAALLYPHVAIHRLVRLEKDRNILRLQHQMLSLSLGERMLSAEEIEQLNGLADLIQKIEGTPNYPRNISLVGSLSFTFLANIASLVIPKEALAAAVRSVLGF